MFTGYALSADKLDCLEYLYRDINISSKAELFWKVFAKNLLREYYGALIRPHDVLDIPVCFPVCYIPIFSTAYYWIYGEYNRTWKRYLEAAANYPFLRVIPSVIGGRFAIDGGAVDNIPLYPLLKNIPIVPEPKLDLIIVLHFDAKFDYRSNFKTDIPIVELDTSFCNGFNKRHYDYSREYIDECLASSFEYGKNIGGLLTSGDGSRESLQAAADEIFLREHPERQRNYSMDRLVSILNSLGRAFRNDARCVKKLF
ncbi:MAG: hypothetical protein J1F71_06925 [Clostridiales bacterium]|nr:hypothetical protein [Clostridiales bacterium]